MKKNIKRRDFIKKASIAGVAATAASTFPAPAIAADRIEINCVATWGRGYPGLGTGAEAVSQRISDLSDGRIVVNHYAGGERVGPLDVFTEVSSGNAQMYNSADYYWVGQHPGWGFFASVPFGLIATEVNGWIRHGGGQELWDELGDQFGLKNFMAGNSGVQMGGWFNKEINSTEDLNGLKMRIPGLGGEVLARAGGTPFTLAGSEIFTSLQTGVIDATEWVGPYNDRAFGLHKAAEYYYYPGWHEPGPTLECIINRQAYNKLSDEHKSIIDIACKAANIDMISDYMSKNYQALEYFKQEQIKIKKFPKEVLTKLNKISNEVLIELSQKNQLSNEVYDSYTNFLKRVRPWTLISEDGYLSSFE